MDSTGSGTSAPPCASVRSCSSTTSGTSLGHRATKDTPQATGGRGPKTSRSLPGRRRAVTPGNAHGGHHPGWVSPLAHTVLTPRGRKAARHNNARRQGTLADPVTAAARRLPRHGESSSMRVWTGTTGAPATPTPNGHHLPPTPLVQEAPHRSGAHSHHSHASRTQATGSASPGPPPGGRQSGQLICRLPPRASGRPAVGGTTRHGHAAKRACGRPKACTRNGGTAPPTAPKPPRH